MEKYISHDRFKHLEKHIFYDRFKNEYTTQREKSAPPERYFFVWRGWLNDIFTEKYIENGRRCGLSYTAIMRNSGVVEDLRQSTFEQYGFVSPRLISWEIPPDMFDEILKSIGGET